MKKKKFWIVGILVVIIIVVGAGFIIFNALSKKDDDDTKEEVKEETKVISESNQSLENFEGTVIEELENVDEKDIYGLGIVGLEGYTSEDDNNDDKEFPDITDIFALNSNGDDVLLLEAEGLDISSAHVLNNRLYISASLGTDYFTSQKSYVIDLNVYPYKIYQLTDGVEYYEYFDFTNKYFFAETIGHYGILKYDFETETEELLVSDDYFPQNIFVYDNKVYYTVLDDKYHDIYYSIDFDGNNKEKVSNDEYKKIFDSLNKIDVYDNDEFILKKNNQTVKISDNSIYLGEEKIYTAKEGRNLEFMHSSDENVIAFYDYVIDEYENGVDFKDFYYYIDSGEFSEVPENGLNVFYQILFEK